MEKKSTYTLQIVRTDSWCLRMWMLHRNQSINLKNKSMDWFLNYKNSRHERNNALLLACIY